MCRYQPSGGEIYIAGQPLSQLESNSVRRQIAMVPQDVVLFNDTLRYNIAYGDPDASDEQVPHQHSGICD